MTQIALYRTPPTRNLATQVVTSVKPTARPARLVQRCSRARRLALEHQLDNLQSGTSRLGRLLDLEA